MFLTARWVLIALVMVIAGDRVALASTREDRAFAAAASAFQDGMWSRAEVELAQFAAKYPQSAHLAEAVMLQAESDLKQQKYAPAINLLTSHESQAGNLADQYVYWIGEAQFQNQDYAAACNTFSRLVHDFPKSHWRLDSLVNAAAAFVRLEQWGQVVALLQEPGGEFETAARTSPGDERVVRGQLLIAEALLKQDKPVDASRLLRSVDTAKAGPEVKWQQTQLLCRAQLASGDTNAALASTTNLIQLADSTGQPAIRAASVVEQGRLLERLGMTGDALNVYRQNLSTNAPLSSQRQAILKIAELAAAQTNFSEAEQSLEQFLARFTNSPSADIARLTLGELYLKHYVAHPTATTNGLQEAQAQFIDFLNTYTNHALAGKAFLDLGWCGWCDWIAGDNTNALNDSLTNFGTAARLLPASVDLAVARFKMGDVMFAQENYAGARDNYEIVWQDLTNFADVDKSLAPQALYQTVRSCMKLRDLEGTTNALGRILTAYPMSHLADNTVLLAGEELSDLQQPEAARALFEKFEELYPTNSLLPEAELALARTYEQETNWFDAIRVYDSWMKRYSRDANLLPQVEYARAMANYQAGNETNALTILTNFVTLYPSNALAPIAQWWIGGYYYNKGIFPEAEKNYELLFQLWPGSPLADQAMLMAGRSAVGRQGYLDAIRYFTTLTEDTNCPPNVFVQALFGYGGALMQAPSSDTNDPLANFNQARGVFEAICQRYPQSEQAALAWGLVGECYLQLAGQPPGAEYYDKATNAYTQVMNSARADAAARSQAQVGIGDVFEKRAALARGQAQGMFLEKALQNYLDVLYGNNLRNGETADPFWVKKAGLQAASVAEELGQWPQAISVYRRLEMLLPQLRDMLEKKIAGDQVNISAGEH